MKFVIALAGSLVVLMGVAALPQTNQQPFSLYNLLIQEILADDKIFQQYYDCLMEKGTCPPGSQQIKDRIAELVSTGCADCTPQRKERIRNVVGTLVAKKGAQYEDIEKKYDPKQVLRKI